MNATAAAGRLEGSAACCSGGGIRSASYCLGALEALATEPGEPAPKVVTAVSGGSYMAAAGALEAARPGRQRAAYLDGFRPGSVIETRLRDHTHYLLPDAVRGVRGILALLWGAVGNVLLVGSLIFVCCALDGWLLSAIGGLTWHGHVPSSTITAWQAWVPAGAGLAAAVTYLLSRLTERPPASPAPLWSDRWQKWTVVLLLLAAATAVLLVAAPALFAALWQAGTGGGPATAPATLTSVGTGGAALGVLAAGAVAFAKAAAGTISAAWRRAGPAQQTVRPWLVRAGQVLAPWLGSALVVLVFSAFGVYIIGTSAAPGYWHWVIAAGAGVFVVMHLLMDVNRSSMHDFYRDRLASAYADRDQASTRLSQLAGGTDVVLCAAANLRTGNPRRDGDGALRGVPPGRGAVSCVFTPDRTELHFPWPGSPPEAARTRTYEDLLRPDRMTVFDLVAISGAAVAPLMGKMTSAARRLLFGAVNLRLGIWVPRPGLVARLDNRTEKITPAGPAAWHRSLPQKQYGDGLHGWALACQLATWDRIRYHHQSLMRHSWARPRCLWYGLLWRAWQPNLLLLWREVAGGNPAKASWIYLSDGAGFDNLGLVEALREHPARIYVIDASCDPQHLYASLGQAIALARSDLGVEISIEPDDMEHPPLSPGSQPAGDARPDTICGRKPDTARPFTIGSYRYTTGPCRGQAGELDVVKLGVWPGHDLPWDVRAYFGSHPSFPRDSTLKQLYDEQDFEAYRELGEASMQALLAYRRDQPVELWIAIQD